MSSHHFVRDKQEPALIIANGQACSDHLLNQLLEWCPFVLVLDGALDRVLMKRIKVDAVLGDFDSIEVDRSSVDKFQEVTWIDAPNQDKTDLEKGIEYLIENGHKAANIVWATGKRLDHTINNVLSMAKYQSQIELVLLDDHSK
ncbi:MAG: thiamine pyrophosphokinase, partial [Bacteroidia bacterium]